MNRRWQELVTELVWLLLFRELIHAKKAFPAIVYVSLDIQYLDGAEHTG
jgi:hypothetical protein